MQGWRRSPPSSRSRRRALTGQAVPLAFGCPRAFVRWSQWISPASTASPVRSADRRTMISFRHSAANFLQPAQGPETPPSFKEPPASKAPRRPSAARDGSKASASCRPAPRRPRARSAARSPQATATAASCCSQPGSHRPLTTLAPPPCCRSAHQPCPRRVSLPHESRPPARTSLGASLPRTQAGRLRERTDSATPDLQLIRRVDSLDDLAAFPLPRCL